MNMSIIMGYEVRYENGASNILHEGLSDSLQKAIEISVDGMLGCMPEGFNPDNLVRPVIARTLGFCALCASSTIQTTNEKALLLIPMGIGHGVAVCVDCVERIQAVGKLRCGQCGKVYKTNAEAEACERVCELPF